MKNSITACLGMTFGGAIIVAAVAGCGERKGASKPSATAGEQQSPGPVVPRGKPFATKLITRGPAPQEYEELHLPAGVTEVQYPSGDLQLKGWLSSSSKDASTRPAVVYLHGGWAFGDSDWNDAAPFIDAGYVLFMPMLRAENGNPGVYESFLGEVDDAIAAGRYVSSLEHVDRNRVFVVGHSVGGVLTCLVAMRSSPFRAAGAFDGYVDMKSWAHGIQADFVPYDPSDETEVKARDPMERIASLQCPLRLIVGNDGFSVNSLLANKARQLRLPCELVEVEGDHQAMVAPAVQRAIAWFDDLR